MYTAVVYDKDGGIVRESTPFRHGERVEPGYSHNRDMDASIATAIRVLMNLAVGAEVTYFPNSRGGLIDADSEQWKVKRVK